MRAFALLLMMCAPAWALPSYEVAARVDAVARTVEGRAKITVEKPGAVELWLWRYPERFASRSPKLNDYNFYWVYPRKFNPGAMRTGAVMIDGTPAAVEVHDHAQAGKGTLLRVIPKMPLGARATLEIDFSVRVPDRYAPLGCHSGRCLLTGFFPLLAEDDLSAPPARGNFRMTIEVPRVSDVVIAGALHPVEKNGRVTVSLDGARPPAVLVGPPRLRGYQASHRGVKILYYTKSGPGVPSPEGFMLTYLPTGRAQRVLNAVKEAIDLLHEFGTPFPAGHTLRLVEGPLLVELARPEGGWVQVSEALFDIFPAGRFLKFHEFQLVRALYADELERRAAARENPADLAWSPDVPASFLVDVYTVRSYKKEEFARQILAWAAFIPAIDRILYAPQVQFAAAYFNTLEDPDPLRDLLTEFNHDRPRGKLIYSKLRDLLGDAGIQKVVRAQLAGEPIRAAAEAEAASRGTPSPSAQGRSKGETLEWFFKQWLGPYPAVDYRFADVRSHKLPDGRVRVTAIIEKRGEHPPVEPVEVRARDKRGNVVVQKWDGQGRRAELTFLMGASLSTIEIDPRGRLVENLPRANDDLRFDDRRPPRWKFIYNNFGGLIRFFPTLGLDLSLDFSLERILDVKNSMRFLVYHTAATQIGVSASYGRSFGRRITQARNSAAWSTSMTVSRIEPDFGRAVGAGDHPGTQIGAGIGVGYGDRLYAWNPRREFSASIGGGFTLTVLDNAQVLWQGTLSGSVGGLAPLADGHGLAIELSAAITQGDLRIPRQMLSAGGAGGLRGYEVDELLGRARVLGRVEWRHVFVHDLNWNILHVLYVRGIGGGLFAEAGMVSDCNSYGVSTSGLGADVGYTLRVFGDWFGVSQTTLNIDVAVPLGRRQRDCFGPLPPPSSRQPLGIFVAFGPPW